MSVPYCTEALEASPARRSIVDSLLRSAAAATVMVFATALCWYVWVAWPLRPHLDHDGEGDRILYRPKLLAAEQEEIRQQNRALIPAKQAIKRQLAKDTPLGGKAEVAVMDGSGTQLTWGTGNTSSSYPSRSIAKRWVR